MKILRIVVSLMLSVMLTAALAASAEAVEIKDISAKAAVLIEAESGKILFDKYSDRFLPMASTTKIMTTLLTLESGGLDEPFTVDTEAIRVEGSSMGLTEGDIVTKRALCYGMLLPSGNDAANASAVKLAGSIEKFSDMMNSRAASIGMRNSFFVTPSGMDAKGHGSTAYDMALLTREAMKNDDFREICSSQNARLMYGNPPYQRWLNNTNKLLKMYDGCIGVKTGFTDEAGRCLVSACERDGITLICVTLNAPDDWNDHMKLYNYGFSAVRLINLEYARDGYEADVVGGMRDGVRLIASEYPQAVLTPSDSTRVSMKVYIPDFVYAPVKQGECIGKIEYLLDGRIVEEVKLEAAEDCAAKTKEENALALKIKEALQRIIPIKQN